jgi:hypothetical protein
MIDPVKLINPRTFIEQHLRLIGKGYSGRKAFAGRKAFEMLNNSYEQEVGIKRYTDYDTFRAAKSYHQKSIKSSQPPTKVNMNKTFF